MISFSGSAYLLRYRDQGETDRVYTVYSRDRGKLDVVAKGIRKAESKLQSSTVFLQELEIYVIAQRRFTLGGSIIKVSFPKIIASLEKMWAGQHILEVVERLTPFEHPDQGLFDSISSAFAILNVTKKTSLERLVFFVSAFDMLLFKHVGIAPQLYPKKGESEEGLVFLRSDGIHQTARANKLPGLRITPTTRTLLRFAQQKSLEECLAVSLTLEQSRAVFQAVRVFLEDHMTSPLKTDALLREMIR